MYGEELDDAPAVARCFAGAFGREPFLKTRSGLYEEVPQNE
jgi:hypothetical protein